MDRPGTGEIVAVANTKGGAGKTALTFNLAHALAGCGARVLVVDLDQQMGQSAFLGEHDQERPDAGAALRGDCVIDDALVRGVYPDLDVLPADEASIGDVAAWMNTDDGVDALADLLNQCRSRWDVVMVDTPGHLSPLVAATLRLSDGVIVPIPPEAGTVTELPTVLNAIATSVETHGRPEVYGVIRTRVWGNSVYRRVAEDQIRTISESYDVPLFKTKIPEDAKFGEAHLVGMPVGAYLPGARSAIAYRYVAYELIQRRRWPFSTPEGV